MVDFPLSEISKALAYPLNCASGFANNRVKTHRFGMMEVLLHTLYLRVFV